MKIKSAFLAPLLIIVVMLLISVVIFAARCASGFGRGDADTETAPRAVDVYMTKLRAKLAACEDFEIKTVHGLGYKAVIK